jgi:hypothetical protein
VLIIYAEGVPVARRYVASVAVGTALAVALTGCRLGGGAEPRKAAPDARFSALDALNRTSQRTNQVGSFRVETAITSGFSGRSMNLKGHADIRLRPSLAQKWIISRMTVAGRRMGGFQEVVLGDSLYLKPPAHALPTRKPWVRFSLRQLGAKSGFDYASSLKEQSDPSATVTMLTASKDVRELGHETVGGVATTHYQGTYSMRDALAKLDTEHRANATRLYGQMGLDRVAFDLWVDGRQLPRKVKLATPAGSKMSLATTTVYTAFNVPVSISAPPRSQVADGAHLPGRRTPGVPT